MFKPILLLLVTLSLCAIYTSAAPKKIVSRQARSSHEDSTDIESVKKYQTIEFDAENASPEIVQLDDEWRLAREVAEADYVPPLKHAYETGNGELNQKAMGTSLNDVKKFEELKDQIELMRKAEVGQLLQDKQTTELAEIEAQIITNYKENDENISRQLKRGEEKNVTASNDANSAERTRNLLYGFFDSYIKNESGF